MKKHSAAELAEIIEKHCRWLRDEEYGERADLSGADLSWSDLSGADLSWSDLSGADLSWSDLSGADLRGASLRGADLRGANLRGASLSWSDLSEADLSWSDLSEADLRGASLRGADLRGANLRGASLRGANLSWSNGNLSEVRAIQCDIWSVTYTATHIFIGCQAHEIQEWWDFDDAAISRMDSRALDWWRVWKPILQQIIAVAPATPYNMRDE